jgi:LysR family transcriptional activator of nhaA
MLKTLNFKHIFYFWIVARESSIRKASILLNVSPSSISEQIKILEDRIGDSLFDRSQKQMSLTSNGSILFNTLDDFFPSIEELFESLVNHKSADVRFLRIGLCPTFSDEMRFDLCFPFIEDIHYTVKIIQGENEYLGKAFDKDEIDILFTTNDNLSVHGKREKFNVYNRKFSIVANPNLYAKLPKSNQIATLGKAKYINYTADSDLHFKIYTYLHKKNINPVRIAEISDFGLIKETLKNLESFAILPINSLKKDLENGSLATVGGTLKSLSSRITAIYKPKFKSPRFEEHLQNIKNHLKTI